MTWLDWLNCVLSIWAKQTNNNSKYTRTVKTTTALKLAFKKYVFFLCGAGIVSKISLFFWGSTPEEQESSLVGRLYLLVQWIFFTNFNILYLKSLSWSHTKHQAKKFCPVPGAKVACEWEGQDLSTALSVIPGDSGRCLGDNIRIPVDTSHKLKYTHLSLTTYLGL